MATCRICGKQIIWLRTPTGKSMPCECALTKYYRGHGQKIVTVDGDVLDCSYVGNDADYLGLGYIPHWGNCGIKAKQKRKSEEKSLF